MGNTRRCIIKSVARSSGGAYKALYAVGSSTTNLEVAMLVRLGRWFVFEAGLGGLYLKAPFLGSVWIGSDGQRYWDK